MCVMKVKSWLRKGVISPADIKHIQCITKPAHYNFKWALRGEPIILPNLCLKLQRGVSLSPSTGT